MVGLGIVRFGFVWINFWLDWVMVGLVMVGFVYRWVGFLLVLVRVWFGSG